MLSDELDATSCQILGMHTVHVEIFARLKFNVLALKLSIEL